MKKKIFGSLAVLAIAALTAFNVNLNSQEISILKLDSTRSDCQESSINAY
ncbi:hypothetical protein [Parabacteroides sp. Marseille-P3160]|nr:hypothetical protein [Parabacteroides sp. Marseille-P3160]